MITIRQATAADGHTMLALRTQVDCETTFMMAEPGERTGTAEQEVERLRIAVERQNPLVLVAVADGELIGFLNLAIGQPRRAQHNGYIVIGILQAFTGQGIGTRLFEEWRPWRGRKGSIAWS